MLHLSTFLILHLSISMSLGWKPPYPVLWKRLDDSKQVGYGLHRFNTTDYAFNISDNLAHCRKNIRILPYDASVSDYGVNVSAELRALHILGGGTLRLLSGVYLFRTPIEIPSFTCLQGAGMYNTTLRLHPQAPPFPRSGMIRSSFTTRVSLLDFTQDGNRNLLPGPPLDRTGILTYVTTYMWMKNVRVINNKEFGVDPHGGNQKWSYYLVIENCISAQNGKDGFTIDQTYFVSMLNSFAYSNDRHGINVVSGSRFVLIKNNKLKDNALCSITVQNNEFGTHSAIIISNIGVGHGLAGICIRNTYNVYAVANMMLSNRARSCLFQFHHVSRVKLVYNEWAIMPGISGKMLRGRGMNVYTMWHTSVINATKAAQLRYFNYFASKHPISDFIDLNGNPYSSSGPVDNSVPTMPQTEQVRMQLSPVIEQLPRRQRRVAEVPESNSSILHTPDSACRRGVRNGLYCCPRSCGVCEFKNCNSTLGPECCPSSIRIDASSCDTFGPPCYLSRKHTTTGRLYGPVASKADAFFPENGDLKPTPTPSATYNIQQLTGS